MPGSKKNIVIAVFVGPDNPPMLDEDFHIVSCDGHVTWLGVTDHKFAIEFADGTPDTNGKQKLESEADGNYQKVKLTAKQVEKLEIYKYSVVAGCNILDPYIIVDPA